MTIKKAIKNPVYWAIALTLIYFAILALRPTEAWFGVPGQWTWSGRPPSPATYPRWWPAMLVLVLLIALGIWGDGKWEKLPRKQRALALTGLVILIPLLQVTLKYIHYPHLFEYYLYRTIGPHNGFWQAAISIQSIGDYVRNYPAHMRASRGVFVHLPVHPPGNILYLWLWRKVFASMPGLAHTIAHNFRLYDCTNFSFVTLHDAQIATAAGQMILPLFSGLTVFPLYRWTQRLSNGRNGWRATVFFSLIPAMHLFSMRWDSLYPLFAVLAFALLQWGLDEARLIGWFLAGLSVSLASFLSFGNATFAPALALYAAAYMWQKGPRALVQNWKSWLALIAGGYTIWGVYQLFTGISVWEVFFTTLEIHLNLGRTYWPWVTYNLYDLVAFTGLPISVLFVVHSARAWQTLPRRQGALHDLPALTVSGIILALNFSGVVRAEVGRMWLPWMPIIAMCATLMLNNTKAKRRYPLLVVLLALQALWMTLFLRVSPTGMPAYRPRTPTRIETPAQHALDVTFEHNIHLTGYSIHATKLNPGETLNVTLYWQGERRPDLQYTVFVHLIDSENQLQAQHDGMPAGGSLPTSCWLAGEIIQDPHPLTLPESLRQGEYRIQIGLYYWPTMDRLSILEGGTGDTLTLPLSLQYEP